MASFLGRLHLGRSDSQSLSPEEAAAAARRAVLIPLAAAQFIASYDSSSMNVAISNIVEDLDTTVVAVQSAISLFLLTMAALMIPGSKLTDIWGRKRCFSLGLMIYATGALITAGFYTRVAAFLASGEMAFAYFYAHAPGSFFPVLNNGDAAILYCFVFLYLAAAGPGPWSVDAAMARGRPVAD